MRILIYGVGVIGSIFAGKLAKKGYDITVLARGNRYNEIKENGIILHNPLNGKTDRISIKLIDTLIETDVFDYVIVPVQCHQIDAILPVLQENKSPNIVFMVNNPLGYEKWINSVGYERIIIGFPSAGGERNNGVVNYFVGKGITKLFQSTTFGELNGKRTKRLKELYKIFKKGGLSPCLNNKMDCWQKTHVSVILPIAKAFYRCKSDNYELAKSYKTLKNMVLGTRELFQVLKSINVQITPRKLYFYYYLPTFIICKIWQMAMNTRMIEYALAKHAVVGREELEELEKQFMTLNKKGIELKHYKNI